MSLPFTSVVGYHMNPLTCGVAKFNAELARRLGVPMCPLLGERDEWGDYPLLSLKYSEFIGRVGWSYPRNYGVFWHDAGAPLISRSASIVFYADPSLGSPGLWCPSLIPARKQLIRLFSFGMAHKLQTEKYRRVRELLDAAQLPYHLRVSVGLHEGTSLDGAEKHFDALKAIMGPEHVTILGILSDEAVSEELHAADYVLAFFENGLRANNTTVHAALETGCEVVTNHDKFTPRELSAATWPIHDMDDWPQCYTSFTWDNLIRQMEALCAASRSTVA